MAQTKDKRQKLIDSFVKKTGAPTAGPFRSSDHTRGSRRQPNIERHQRSYPPGKYPRSAAADDRSQNI